MTRVLIYPNNGDKIVKTFFCITVKYKNKLRTLNKMSKAKHFVTTKKKEKRRRNPTKTQTKTSKTRYFGFENEFT